MKNKFYEIITKINVARSNNCTREKSEEFKGIINELLPYADAWNIITNREVDVGLVYESNNYEDYVKRMTEYFDTIVKYKANKEQWLETFLLEEEEYDLLRSLL
jgi:hypothetical protein